MGRMDGWKGPLYLCCAFTLAGTGVISARFVTGKLGVFTISSVSLFFALLFLLPFCAKKLAKTIRGLPARDYFSIILQALCGIFLFRMFLLRGLMLTSSGEAGILIGATPAITALLAIVLLKEGATGTKLAGILSTVAGIMLLQGLLAPDNSLAMEHFWGNMLVLCAAACGSLFSIFSRIFALRTAAQAGHTINALTQTALVSAAALLLCLIAAIFEKPVPLLDYLGVKEWLALLWYGPIVTTLAYIYWFEGIKRCGAFTAAAFSGMMPFTSMFLSVIVLRESMGRPQWTGGMLIVIGMLLLGRGNCSVKKPLLQISPIKEKEQVSNDVCCTK